MTRTRTGHIVVTISVRKEDGYYQAECLELGVPSFGETLGEAFDRACEAVILYLNTIEAEGQCKRIFAERGVKIIWGKVPATKRQLSARVGEFVSPQEVQIPSLAAVG